MGKSATKFVVRVSRARMPSSCWGTYYRVAVLDMTPDAPEPKMISERARGCVRIVRTWEKCRDGSTPKCAVNRAIRGANLLAAELNHSTVTA